MTVTASLRAFGPVVQSGSASSTIDLQIPSSAVVGDLLIAYVHSNDNQLSGPDGWREGAGSGYYPFWSKRCQTGDPGATVTFTNADAVLLYGVVGAYQNALLIEAAELVVYGSDNPRANAAAPTYTTGYDNELIVEYWHAASLGYTTGGTPGNPQVQHGIGLTPPQTSRLVTPPVYGKYSFAISDQVQASAGGMQTQSCAADRSITWVVTTLSIRSDSPPNAPASPSIPSPFNRLQPLTVNPVFSDPDAGDSPSRLYARTRMSSSDDWTVVSQDGPSQQYTFPAGTFPGGQVEFQFAYQDSQGAPADTSQLLWSASVFATGAVPSNVPTITSPANGATINTNNATVTLNFPGGDAFRYYVTLADGTSLVPVTTITDPNAVASRQFTLSGLANGSTIKIFAAYHDANGWTSYAESDNPVSFTPPTTATFTAQPICTDPTIAPYDDAIELNVTNPAPESGGVPTVSVDVLASSDGGTTVEWSRSGLMPNATVMFDTPASGIDYVFQVVSHADNGTTSSTGWQSGDPSGVAFADNGDGTYTASGVTDNDDGTFTAASGATDNGDGTFTGAAA